MRPVFPTVPSRSRSPGNLWNSIFASPVTAELPETSMCLSARAVSPTRKRPFCMGIAPVLPAGFIVLSCVRPLLILRHHLRPFPVGPEQTAFPSGADHRPVDSPIKWTGKASLPAPSQRTAALIKTGSPFRRRSSRSLLKATLRKSKDKDFLPTQQVAGR